MSESTILAFDLGTSALKAAIISSRATIIDSEVVSMEIVLTPDGGAEQAPDDWWQAMIRASQSLWQRGTAKASEVIGISLSSQWSGTVAIGQDGKPLRNALTWMDSRGMREVRRIIGGFPSVDGYNVPRALTWIKKTGGVPSPSGKDPVGHIAWLRKNEPKTFDATKVFLEPKDWVNYKLTGRASTSFDAIALHWVTDNRDINNIRYDDQLIKLCEMEKSKLPELMPAASIVGTLTSEAASALGVSTSVKVASGSADVHAAAIGAGTVEDYQAHLCLGTSSWLIAHVPFKRSDLNHNMASLPSAIPGRYLFCNEQESGAGGLKHVIEVLLNRADPGAYNELFALAEQTKPGAEGLMWLPWLHGERSPVDDPKVRGGFAGLGLSHKQGHLVRAILEGVAFNTRWLQQHLEDNLKQELSSVTVVGGGARSALWCQILADVLGRPIRQTESPQMSNARGAAMGALVALGQLKWSDIPGLVPISKTFAPKTELQSMYTERFAQFLEEFKHRRKMSRRFFGDGKT